MKQTDNHNTLLKTSRPGKHIEPLSFKSYPDDKLLCVVTCLKQYLQKTSQVRDGNDKLWLSFNKPHKPVVVIKCPDWLIFKKKKKIFKISKFQFPKFYFPNFQFSKISKFLFSEILFSKKKKNFQNFKISKILFSKILFSKFPTFQNSIFKNSIFKNSIFKNSIFKKKPNLQKMSPRRVKINKINGERD